MKEENLAIIKALNMYGRVPEQWELLNEIERLKEQLNDEIDDELKQSEIMVKKQEEIERLNNIINEYDKWLESEIQRLEKFQNPKRGVKPYGQEYNNITFLIGAYDNALDKLQELKGSDKE